MSNFLGLVHSEKRRRKLNVGGTEVIRYEYYCRLHGWVDAFFVGGDEGFAKKHGECDGDRKRTGAEFEKSLKATA